MYYQSQIMTSYRQKILFSIKSHNDILTDHLFLILEHSHFMHIKFVIWVDSILKHSVIFFKIIDRTTEVYTPPVNEPRPEPFSVKSNNNWTQISNKIGELSECNVIEKIQDNLINFLPNTIDINIEKYKCTRMCIIMRFLE